MTVYTSGEFAAHGRCVAGEACVNVLMGASGVARMTPAEARKLSDELLVAAVEAEVAAAELIEAAQLQVAADKRYGLAGAAHDGLVAALARVGGAQ